MVREAEGMITKLLPRTMHTGALRMCPGYVSQGHPGLSSGVTDEATGLRVRDSQGPKEASHLQRAQPYHFAY